MDRRVALVALVAAAALWAVLAVPLLSAQVYIFNDLGLVHLPVRAFYAECLATGRSFLWWPAEFTGVYLHGEGQGGLLHPLQWLSYRLLPLTLAFQLELLRSPLLAFAGSFLLLRRWALARSAALLGALLVAFSGFLLLHYMHLNLIGVWAQLPWLLLCIHLALEGTTAPRRAAALAGLVLLTASQLLLGHPQGVWLSLVVEAPYAVLVASQGGGLRSLSRLAVACLLGLGVAGVQVLPTLDSLAASSRAAAGPDFAATPALAPADLLQLFGPYLFEKRVAGGIPWERGLWPGAVPLVLAVWVLARGRELRRARALALFGLGLAGVGLWLALGDAGGLYRLQRLLPGLDLLRAPARYVGVFQFGLALAAAVGFHDLMHLPAPLSPRRLWPVFAPAALAMACLLAAVSAAGSSGVRAESALALAESPLALAAGPLLLLAASACVALAGAGRALALPLLVVLAAVDLGSYGLGFVRSGPTATLAGFVSNLRVPPVAAGWRVVGERPSLAMRLPLADGYLGLVPQRRVPFRTPASLRAAAVGFAFGAPVARPLARARLISHARRSDDPARDLGRIDLEREALVERDLALGGSTAGSARIVRDHPGEIEVEVSSPGRQLLVLSESHHPGWRASVDSAACRVERVNGDYLGCVVEAGEHTVAFRFDPPSLRRGRWLSALSLVCALVWCAWLARRTPRGG